MDKISPKQQFFLRLLTLTLILLLFFALLITQKQHVNTTNTFNQSDSKQIDKDSFENKKQNERVIYTSLHNNNVLKVTTEETDDITSEYYPYVNRVYANNVELHRYNGALSYLDNNIIWHTDVNNNTDLVTFSYGAGESSTLQVVIFNNRTNRPSLKTIKINEDIWIGVIKDIEWENNNLTFTKWASFNIEDTVKYLYNPYEESLTKLN